jgi:hypothetical protein
MEINECYIRTRSRARGFGFRATEKRRQSGKTEVIMIMIGRDTRERREEEQIEADGLNDCEQGVNESSRW